MASVFSKSFVTQNASKLQNVGSWSEISVVCLVYSLKLIRVKFSIAAYAFCFFSVLCITSYINSFTRICWNTKHSQEACGPDFRERWLKQ